MFVPVAMCRLHEYNAMNGACSIQGYQVRCTTLQLEFVEALWKTRPKSVENLAMSPRSSRRLLEGSVWSKGTLRQQIRHPKERYWHTTPDSASNCLSTLYEVAAVALDCSSRQDSEAFNEPVRKKRKIYGLQGGGMKGEEQVTRDLYHTFQNEESTELPNSDVVPRRSTSNSSDRMNMHRSGFTSEEDDEGNAPNDSALATVITAAELLTQLTCGRNMDTNRQSTEATSCLTYSPYTGKSSDQPIRWGVKKKVSYETRRSMDSCDLGLCTGLTNNVPDEEKATSVPPGHAGPDQKFEKKFYCRNQNSNSSAKKWMQSSPNSLVSSRHNRRLEPSGDQNISNSALNLLSGATQVARDQQQNKTSLTSRTVSGNILKLPKEMQGRWSSERYKSAQLKLIDIMHARKAVPGKPILRPVLREEARKHIGDTGLLDHLLKHMTDTIVSTGERFRRRHNSEGAMEYWLEHASLMELRKEAGVEDPSWIPPPEWKPGDKLLNRNWRINHGMTSSEAAEMRSLKETVERLNSEMKILCGSIKVSNQHGTLICPSLFHEKRLESVPFGTETEDDSIKGIRKDMTHFKTELTNIQQQFHEEHKSCSANPTISSHRFQKLENESLQMFKSRKAQEDIPCDNQLDLEGQLQDVRRTVAVMQADVSCIMNILGIVQPIRYPFEPSAPENALSLVLSRSEDTSVKHVKARPQSPGTSGPVLYDFDVIPKLDAPIRQCTTLDGALSSSSGCNTANNVEPHTEGLSQAVTCYKLVEQSGKPGVHVQFNQEENSTGSIVTTQDSLSLMGDNKEKRVNVFNAQNFQPMLQSKSTGFRICRPPEVRVEDEAGHSSISGELLSPHMVSVKNLIYSPKSITESQIAATMAGMLGHTAVHEVAKLEMQGPLDTVKAINPAPYSICQGSQQSSCKVLTSGHSGSTGVDLSASPESWSRLHIDQSQETKLQKATSVSPTCRLTLNSLQQKPEIKVTEPPHLSLPILPLMTMGTVPAARISISTARNPEQCSPAVQFDPALSLSLSLTMSPKIYDVNSDIIKPRSI
nr:uncharacterized protein LOC112275601 isoform X3 [Physcomitrium patens]|eukprot:XP_024361864.1 uncharacterized protein LOC112275601 isoform X3 [Physcomitrella patens]